MTTAAPLVRKAEYDAFRLDAHAVRGVSVIIRRRPRRGCAFRRKRVQEVDWKRPTRPGGDDAAMERRRRDFEAVMAREGISRAELARQLGCSRARVTRVLGTPRSR